GRAGRRLPARAEGRPGRQGRAEGGRPAGRARRGDRPAQGLLPGPRADPPGGEALRHGARRAHRPGRQAAGPVRARVRRAPPRPPQRPADAAAGQQAVAAGPARAVAPGARDRPVTARDHDDRDAMSTTDPEAPSDRDAEPTVYDRGRRRAAGDEPAPLRASGGWDRHDAISTTSWQQPPEHLVASMDRDVVVDMGWGRVLFGQTFRSASAIVSQLRDEAEGRRDICLYARDPHVLVAKAPQELFVDPSYTYRFWLHRTLPRRDPPRGIVVRSLSTRSDADAVNRIYVVCGMVPAPPEVLWSDQQARHITYLVAEDTSTGELVGTVAGIDHPLAFDDPEGGRSLWTLAVDPGTQVPGVGEALV